LATQRSGHRFGYEHNYGALVEIGPIERFVAWFNKTDNSPTMDLSQVTLTQIRYALAVEEARSFRAAAQNCHVSQSGLSMQLQKLEELLGVTLFDRSRKPVVTTDIGRDALAQMSTILRETERLGQIVTEETEPAGPFRLGVIPTLSSAVIPLFLPDFVARYPRVELTLEELKTEDIVTRLSLDQLDAGILATPLHTPGIHETALGLESFYAYLPPADPLLKKKRVTQADLGKRQLWVMPEGHCFRTQVLSYCRAGKARPSGPVHFESGSFQTLISLVDDGLGATVIPALVARRLTQDKRDAQLRPLFSPSPVREIGLVRSRKDLRRKVSEALASIVREKLAEVLPPLSPRAQVLEPLRGHEASNEETTTV
jgi:LysR family hydrogen peroxide-inducible transcriptional activator